MNQIVCLCLTEECIDNLFNQFLKIVSVPGRKNIVFNKVLFERKQSLSLFMPDNLNSTSKTLRLILIVCFSFKKRTLFFLLFSWLINDNLTKILLKVIASEKNINKRYHYLKQIFNFDFHPPTTFSFTAMQYFFLQSRIFIQLNLSKLATNKLKCQQGVQPNKPVN